MNAVMNSFLADHLDAEIGKDAGTRRSAALAASSRCIFSSKERMYPCSKLCNLRTVLFGMARY